MWKETNRSRSALFNIVKIVDKRKSEELTEILWIGH